MRQMAVTGVLYDHPGDRALERLIAEVKDGSLYEFPAQPGGWYLGKPYYGDKKRLRKVPDYVTFLLLDIAARETHPDDPPVYEIKLGDSSLRSYKETIQ